MVPNSIAAYSLGETVTSNASEGGVTDVVAATLRVNGGVLQPVMVGWLSVMVGHFKQGVHLNYFYSALKLLFIYQIVCFSI
jgi:hypothetical protein